MKLFRKKSLYLCFLSVLMAGNLWGTELSLTQGGFYQTRTDDLYNQTTLTVGSRYAMQFADRMYWYAEGGVELSTFTGPMAPDNATSVQAGGGVRYYFNRLNEFFVPYALGFGYLGSHSQTVGTTSTTTTQQTGLYYGSSFGMRWNLAPQFFMDFESNLFLSSLYEREQIKTSSRVGGQRVSTTEANRTRMEVYGRSFGDLSNIRLAIGMRI